LYGLEQLSTSRHQVDLHQEEAISLFLDEQHMGLGGIDSWGSKPLENYRLALKERTFSIYLNEFRR